MGAINARAFARPDTIRRALGFGAEGGGITHHEQIEIQPGTRLFRFGQKRLKDERFPKYKVNLSPHGLFATAASGEWWLEQEGFDQVCVYARENKIAIDIAIRQLCIVPEDWSDVDSVIEAEVIAPLLAYRGLPRPANVGGKRYAAKRDNHNKWVKQLYIPGLGAHDVFRAALMIGNQTFRASTPVR